MAVEEWGGHRTEGLIFRPGLRIFGWGGGVLTNALLAIGDWDEADTLSAAALRAMTDNFPYVLLLFRADLKIGRGDFDAARAHLEAAAPILREDSDAVVYYHVFVSELALWERRWADADKAVREDVARMRSATPPRSASGSAPRDCAPRRSWQRSHAPAAMPTPPVTGPLRHGS